MKDAPTPSDGKTAHERFLALGKKVMAVPRSTVVAAEKKSIFTDLSAAPGAAGNERDHVTIELVVRSPI